MPRKIQPNHDPEAFHDPIVVVNRGSHETQARYGFLWKGVFRSLEKPTIINTNVGRETSLSRFLTCISDPGERHDEDVAALLPMAENWDNIRYFTTSVSVRLVDRQSLSSPKKDEAVQISFCSRCMKETKTEACSLCKRSNDVSVVCPKVLSEVTATYEGHARPGFPGQLTIKNSWNDLNKKLEPKVFREDCDLGPLVVDLDSRIERMLEVEQEEKTAAELRGGRVKEINGFKMHPDTWQAVMRAYEKFPFLVDRTFNDRSELILRPKYDRSGSIDPHATAKFKVAKRLFVFEGYPVVLSKLVKKNRIQPIHGKIKRKPLPGRTIGNVCVEGFDSDDFVSLE